MGRVSMREPTIKIIAIVGIDGAGKTTQAQLLAGWLRVHGHPADYWQNAGGRRWFGRLARLFGRRDAQGLLGVGGMLFMELTLRWLAVARAVIQSRSRRRIAVMDRYSWCQYASVRTHCRMAGRTRDERKRTGRERWARQWYSVFPDPDLTIFLAVRPGRAYARVETRGTDHEDLDYLAAADAAYRSLPEFASFQVIDANGDHAEVQYAMRTVVAARLGIDAATPDAVQRLIRTPVVGA